MELSTDPWAIFSFPKAVIALSTWPESLDHKRIQQSALVTTRVSVSRHEVVLKGRGWLLLRKPLSFDQLNCRGISLAFPDLEAHHSASIIFIAKDTDLCRLSGSSRLRHRTSLKMDTLDILSPEVKKPALPTCNFFFQFLSRNS